MALPLSNASYGAALIFQGQAQAAVKAAVDVDWPYTLSCIGAAMMPLAGVILKDAIYPFRTNSIGEARKARGRMRRKIQEAPNISNAASPDYTDRLGSFAGIIETKTSEALLYVSEDEQDVLAQWSKEARGVKDIVTKNSPVGAVQLLAARVKEDSGA